MATTAPSRQRATHRPPHLVTMLLVLGIHLLAAGLLIVGRAESAVPLALAGFAYTRGLLHSLDADHLCMIDGSTRKLLGEGHNANGVGLAFSLGHSTIVLAAGAAVVAGAAWMRTVLNPDSRPAQTLGMVGSAMSASYLLAIALANIPNLLRPRDYHSPVGPWARLLTKPLGHVRNAGHIYVFGILFGLGFDTASTISLLMITALATSPGASPIVFMALPLSFTAAMTLGDSTNANLMLTVYSRAVAAKRARFNAIVTAVSISCAILVSVITAVNIASTLSRRPLGSVDTAPIGWGLLGFAVVGAAIPVIVGRHHGRPAPTA